MKSLNAVKCMDGFIVTISNIIKVLDKEDIKTLIDLHELKIKKEFSNETRIYAE